MLWRFFLLLTFATSAIAQKPAFTVGWSVYAGWTPYHYLNKSGILRKWADKYGITTKCSTHDAPSLDHSLRRTSTRTRPGGDARPLAYWLLPSGYSANGNDALLRQRPRS
jgi:NitT/TauT family transport system substrate-binding protein